DSSRPLSIGAYRGLGVTAPTPAASGPFGRLFAAAASLRRRSTREPAGAAPAQLIDLPVELSLSHSSAHRPDSASTDHFGRAALAADTAQANSRGSVSLGRRGVEQYGYTDGNDEEDADDAGGYDSDDGSEKGTVDEIYDSVDAVVSRSDDPTLPALTARVWILGGFFTVFFAAVNTLFLFRTASFSLSPYLGTLLAYPMGIFLSWVLPTTHFWGGYTLNPGKFNHKEHALLAIICSTAAAPTFALYNIIGQRYQLYQVGLTSAACVAFAIVSQLFTIGLAGLCTRFLVRPAAMLWPSTLAAIALLKSLHENDSAALPRRLVSRFSFFWAVASITLVYEFFPLFITPILVAVSIMCYIAPDLPSHSSIRPLYSAKVLRGLGSANYNGGLGFLSFSFDWSVISQQAPIITPLWSLLNQFIGAWIALYIVVPIVWTNSLFYNDFQLGTSRHDGPNGTGRFPLGFALNTPALFDSKGKYLSAHNFVNKTTLTLNEAYYEAHAPILVSSYFATEFCASFVVFTSAIVHVALWYGKDVWDRFRTAVGELDANDIHTKMMEVYPAVPVLWYIALQVVCVVAAVAVCEWGGFDLPWWGVLSAVLLSSILIIPVGTIQAISGQQLVMNVPAEFLMGLILPGRMVAVMAFKTLSSQSMSTGLTFLGNMKFSHYLKIPPRAVFAVKLSTLALAALVNVFAAFWIYESFGRSEDDEFIIDGDPTSGLIWRLQSADPPEGWSANNFNIFISAGAIWGAIGPTRFFGGASPYARILWGLLAGAVAPVVPYVLHRLRPQDGFWHLINIPLLAMFPVQAGSYRSDMFTPLAVGVLVNYFIKRHDPAWWRRYAYTMAAALDSGTAIALAITFFAFTFSARYQVLMPYYALHYPDAEGCAPSYYLTCTGNENYGKAFGRSYNFSEDLYCSSIYFSVGVRH
ncbi:hypothetical protein HK405_010116, partial [Cladochytrium tenue]